MVLKRSACGRNREVYIGGVTARNLGKHTTVYRGNAIKNLGAGGGDTPSVDECAAVKSGVLH
jgi:hypothetical protein